MSGGSMSSARRKRIWSQLARRLMAGLLIAFGLVGGRNAALAQLFAIPVADYPRRELAEAYDELRDREMEQQWLEFIYDLANGTELGSRPFRDVEAALEGISAELQAAAELGYSAADLARTFEELFYVGERFGGGYDPRIEQERRTQALLRTYRAILASGPVYADDLRGSASFIGALKGTVEGIGTGIFGLLGLGSHEASLQATVPLSLASAEELLYLRQALALQTNSDIIQYAEEIAADQEEILLLERILFGSSEE